MRKITGICIVVMYVTLSPFAAAQISISESELTDRIGTTLPFTLFETDSGAGLAGLVAASGANQVWDFSVINFTDTTQLELSYVALPADLPGSDIPELASAQFVEYTVGVVDADSVKALLYQRLENNELQGLGLIALEYDSGVADTAVVLASVPTIDAVFPITFESTWRDSTSLIFNGEPELIYTTSEVTIDGWGTLVTPTGSLPALRLYQTDSNYLISSNTLLSEDVYIDFITAEGVTASIELDEAGMPISAEIATLPASGTDVEQIDSALPESFVLEQNYPNPFNPSTTINYAVAEQSAVKVQVFTLTGKLVKTLVDAVQVPGTYQVRFDASELASGAYLYRIETNTFTQSKLMSLVK